ncbi:hypothetical protein V5F59_05705 [Xanthobacter autotrophicus DSM 431]|uniref:phage head-tail joining protein n=1 Tax=Xanthobacter nonsaccharivorans TaxID=3119912 RepID=UPI00372A559E
MADLTELQARWEALQEARASGVLRVVTQTAGVRKEVQFRSDAELASAIAAVEAQMRGARTRVTYIAAQKGF